MSNATYQNRKRRTNIYNNAHNNNNPICIQYPDCAAQNRVSQTWLSIYYHDLPPGTIIRYPSGKSVTTLLPKENYHVNPA